jgi:hypothetical protein
MDDKPGIQVRQLMVTTISKDTQRVFFDFKENSAHEVVVGDRKYDIRLLQIGRETIQGQDFPFFEFLVMSIIGAVIPGQTQIDKTEYMIQQINELIHTRLDTNWMAGEWRKMESLGDPSQVHPFLRVAFAAYQQIQSFISRDAPGITPEIFELAELAIKINALCRRNTPFLKRRVDNLISPDFALYLKARYEIQIAGMLLQRGHAVEFIDEGDKKTPDILVTNPLGRCEVECKHKDPAVDQVDYIRSIYNNTQTARKQFSKTCPGVVTIEIDQQRFDEFMKNMKGLKEEIDRAMRNSRSISAILLTAKILTLDESDHIYRHCVFGFMNEKVRHPLQTWFTDNFITYG